MTPSPNSSTSRGRLANQATRSGDQVASLRIRSARSISWSLSRARARSSLLAAPRYPFLLIGGPLTCALSSSPPVDPKTGEIWRRSRLRASAMSSDTEGTFDEFSTPSFAGMNHRLRAQRLRAGTH